MTHGVVVLDSVTIKRLIADGHTCAVGRVNSGGGVVLERSIPDGDVTTAGGISNERFKADGRIAETVVISKRSLADGHVLEACGIYGQGESTYCSVGGAG